MAQVYRGGRLYGSDLPDRLTPHGVRTREFSPRRRGVDADQVREFQAELADELADLHRQVRLLTEENERLKRALRDWQSMHARHCRPNRGHW
ncbi:DivIVA domain-containing protein [Micromonospora echinospora]|uniref:DivIVA domain-containing protein n=1 Tax=Micromonospora echinospora TaxID=1877 RepID=A0A1C4YKS9_MICEC|nr:DivIVA domain-containing protein [Micromonospora echinospora]SCF21270.1 DivIVA domain-containing protein [Micromonospora echinospora]